MDHNEAAALVNHLGVMHGIESRWPAGPRHQPLQFSDGGGVPVDVVRARARYLLLEAIGDATARDGDSRCPRLEEWMVANEWMTRAEANEARTRFGLPVRP